MANANSTAPLTSQFPINAETICQAKGNFDAMSEQMDRIYAIASTAQKAQESLPEDSRDLTAIQLFDLIAEIAGDARYSIPLGDALKGMQAQVEVAHA